MNQQLVPHHGLRRPVRLQVRSTNPDLPILALMLLTSTIPIGQSRSLKQLKTEEISEINAYNGRGQRTLRTNLGIVSKQGGKAF